MSEKTPAGEHGSRSDDNGTVRWARPRPLVGDRTSASERGAQVGGWAFPLQQREAFYEVVAARRDVRRFRSDPVDAEVLERLLAAAHTAPSVGHSQPWRFVVVDEPSLREHAGWMADRARLAQAALLDAESARHLLDLQLEGIREAPVGVVVCCDRRTPPGGVLGRATFPDTDVWSCVAAIENLWLAARAEGLGVGWVTLFEPAELADLVGLPEGVTPLGWLCVGWPDERPPFPGLERVGWSRRQPLDDLVFRNRWPDRGPVPEAPVSRLRGAPAVARVAARDLNDELLTPVGSLGVLDRAVDTLLSFGIEELVGSLVLAVGRHPVVEHGVSVFDGALTDELLAAAHAGEAVGCVAARSAGLDVVVVDAGTSRGDLLHEPTMTDASVEALVDDGRRLGVAVGRSSVVALGEIGIGNTTVAAALAAGLLNLSAEQVVGLGVGADADTLQRKQAVITGALARCRATHQLREDPLHLLGCFGGPEFAFLTGVVLGAAEAGGVVILDGLATTVAAFIAARLEPAVISHLVAGQRSRERAHGLVLDAVGLEPLLALRIRAGEGVGAALAAGLLRGALMLRTASARTSPHAAQQNGMAGRPGRERER